MLLEKEVAAYQAQKKNTNNLAVLALATFVFFSLNLTWNKLTGTEFKVAAFSSSSMLLGLFDLIVGGKSFWSMVGETTKAQRIASKSLLLSEKQPELFMGRRQNVVKILSHTQKCWKACKKI